MFKIFFFFTLSLSFLTGCVTTTRTDIKVVKTDEMKTFYEDGQQIFESKKDKSLVSLKIHTPDIRNAKKEKLYLFLKFKNLNSTPVTVSNENVSVTRNSINKPLHILSYEELIKEAVRDEGVSYLLASSPVQQDIILERLKKRKEKLKNTILKKNTLAPNDSVKGLIAVETQPLLKQNNKTHYTVTVSFAGDTHKFHVQRTKKQ